MKIQISFVINVYLQQNTQALHESDDIGVESASKDTYRKITYYFSKSVSPDETICS